MGSYLPLITGSGGALVCLAVGMWLLITGKIHTDGEVKALEAERDYWRDACQEITQALTIERRIATETAQAGQVNVQLINALTEMAAHRSGRQAPRRKPGLTAEDLGL